MNALTHQRDHGGNLDAAIKRYGGDRWIDLSTGINRTPWPIPSMPQRAWTDLPTQTDKARLMDAARVAYNTTAPGLALAGAQSAIQLVPSLRDVGLARILGPTYNEHAAQLIANGWQVEEVGHIDALDGADLAVVVNPNNPGGEHYTPEQLLSLKTKVGTLVVDESFGDARPELSVVSHANQKGLWVMRSFGKFYGLAGLRLGFLFADNDTILNASEMGGPWPVSGIAIEIGCQALMDNAWKQRMIETLRADAERLDALAQQRGWRLAGGTELFRTYVTPNAADAQQTLAKSQIWTRIFPWSKELVRIGLPGNEAEWEQLVSAL